MTSVSRFWAPLFNEPKQGEIPSTAWIAEIGNAIGSVRIRIHFYEINSLIKLLLTGELVLAKVEEKKMEK